MAAQKVQRRPKVIAAERKKPLGWFYLSFAEDTRFLGAAIVQARGILTAVEHCNDLGINPGGEVACWPIREKDLYRISADLRNRRLSEEEVLKRLDGRWMGA